LVALLVVVAAAKQCSLDEDTSRNWGAANEHAGTVQKTDTAERCRDLCAGEPLCQQYSYNTKSQWCYRSSRLNDETSANKEFISGKCETEGLVSSSRKVDRPASCYEAKLAGVKNEAGNVGSGVFTIYPGQGSGLRVWCDQKTAGGGWAVIQRRVDETDFYRTWSDYSSGFGAVGKGSHWLGLDNINRITQTQASLRIKLKPFGAKRAKYDDWYTFAVGDAGSRYVLTVNGYNQGPQGGLGGDSMQYHNGRPFGTRDRENGQCWLGCANQYKGAWWYGCCHVSNLNGIWADPNGMRTKAWATMAVWYHFPGHSYTRTFQSITMMVRSRETSEPLGFTEIARERFDMSRSRVLVPANVLPMTGKYTYMFYLRMTGVSWWWRSILHKGHANYERSIGVWGWPGSSYLLVCSGTRSRIWWWMRSRDPIEIGKWVHVTVAHNARSARLYLDGVLDQEHALNEPALTNSGPLYAGDQYWYHQAQMGQLANVRYKPAVTSELETEITEAMSNFTASSAPTQFLLAGPESPSRGKRITAPVTDANQREYTWMFWVKPEGTVSGWSNILHFGNSDWERSIAVWFWPGSTTLHMVSGQAWHWNMNLNAGPLPVGQWTHVMLTHRQGHYAAYFNNKLVAQYEGWWVMEPFYRTASLFLGDPWYPSAQAQVQDLRFIPEVLTAPERNKRVREMLKTYYPTKEALKEARATLKAGLEPVKEKPKMDVALPKAVKRALKKVKAANKEPKKPVEEPKKPKVSAKELKKLVNSSPRKLVKTSPPPKIVGNTIDKSGKGTLPPPPKTFPGQKAPKARTTDRGFNRGWLAGWEAGWKEGTVNNQQ